jgi:hypothetical protein
MVSLTAPAEGASVAAPGPITVTATASDSDGTVSAVTFYANGALIGTATTSPYSISWSGVAVGTYALTAVAMDNMGATTTSAPVHVMVTLPAGRVNVALASNGATAVTSSSYSVNYPESAAIDGDRKGLGWGAGGGWNDATFNVYPDWLEVDFSGPKTIDEIDVFSVQDSYAAPVEPTPSMSFNLYGLTDFQVQYWTGTQWVAVPGGIVSGNRAVWRQITFGAITTSRIRVFVTGALNGYSRLTEVEAYQVTP